MRLEDIEMTGRLANRLRDLGIETIEELATRTPVQVLRCPGLGRKCFNELVSILAAHGLSLAPNTL